MNVGNIRQKICESCSLQNVNEDSSKCFNRVFSNVVGVG